MLKIGIFFNLRMRLIVNDKDINVTVLFLFGHFPTLEHDLKLQTAWKQKAKDFIFYCTYERINK